MSYPTVSDLVTFDVSVQNILNQGNGSLGVAISGDESTLAVSGSSLTVFLRKNGNSWVQKSSTLINHGGHPRALSLSYDGNICVLINRQNDFEPYVYKLSLFTFDGSTYTQKWATDNNLDSTLGPNMTTLTDNGSLFSYSDKFVSTVYRYDTGTQSVSTVTVVSVGGAGQIGQISHNGSIFVTLCRTDDKIRLYTYNGYQYNFSSELQAEVFPVDSNVDISRLLNKAVCTGDNFLYTAGIVNGTTLANRSSRINVGEVITSRKFSPDGNRLYVGCGYASQVKIYNTEGQNPVLLSATGTPAELSGASYPSYGFLLSVGGYGSLIVGSANQYPYLFQLDTQPPQLNLVNGIQDGATIIRSLGTTDPYDLVESVIDNRDGSLNKYSYVTFVNYPNTLYETSVTGQNVTIRAIDKSGNATTKTITMIVDGTAPVINAETNVRVALGDEPNPNWLTSAYDLVDGDVTGNVTSNFPAAFTTEGTFSYTYSVTDRAGNTSNSSISVVVDGTGPVITFTDIANPLYVKKGGSLPSDYNVSSITDNTEGNIAFGNMSVTGWPTTTAEEGTYVVEYTVSDSVGNVTRVTRQIVIDGTGPVITFTTSKNPITLLKGEPVPFDRWIASVSDLANGGGIPITDVNVSGLPANTNTAGVFNLTFTVSDTLGNQTIERRSLVILNQAYQIPICFVASTPITTDQGEIAISELMPGVNTINGNCIYDITKTISTEDTLVKISVNALGENVPSRDTVMTNKHKVVYNGELMEAGRLLWKEGISHIGYSGEFVYNVVMGSHTTIVVNNMECETLDPKNIQYKLMELHKRMLTGGCSEEMGVEFSELIAEHKRMCV